jgi:hypothetical protein
MLTATVLAMSAFLFYINSESYCWFKPDIATAFASGYSERGFKELRHNATLQEVRLAIGEPLWIFTNSTDATQIWFYSKDRPLWWADWAWLHRSLTIKNGHILEINALTAFD